MDEEQRPAARAATNAEGVSLDTIPLHSTNLLTVLEGDGTIRYESPSIERVFGYEQDRLVGQQVADYFHPEDRQRVVAAFNAVVESEAYVVESVEYRHQRADGTYCWVESVASSDPTPEGYYVVNTRDISAQKEREAQLERTNERLDDFVSVVSHDLRNPLNVAAGRLQLVEEECDSDHLDDVERAHGRMITLVEDLLALARGGEEVAETESVDLRVFGRRCWRTVETEAATLVTDSDASIRADRSRLGQLLENLMRNGVAHGGDDVTVTLGTLDDSAGFYVADDGDGIAEDRREAVFERGHSTSVDGTGFGLSIVAEIAEAHGWAVRLTESSDGGARFEITGVEMT
jgi:PAS domain S-box-containing protein